MRPRSGHGSGNHGRATPPSRLLAVSALLLAVQGLSPVPGWGQIQTIACPAGFDVGLAPAPPLALKSLKTVPNPVLPNGPSGAIRPDLTAYIANQTAAIRLGKALFWDMQAGSDGKTACATCHFRGGADGRDRNQLHPGPNGTFDAAGLNGSLTSGAFPFTTLAHDRDDVCGSQGVRRSAFQGVSTAGAESTASVPDPVFNAGGLATRQVTGMNAPSVVNAVFNHRQFGNGRAQPEFNGVNPWGLRDLSARVWMVDAAGNLATAPVRIQNASLASQAVGPILNTTEMSAEGRTFPDVGRKLLLLKPLGLQKVDPRDGVLGKLADTKKGRGLTTTYASLIQQAFQPTWWKTSKPVVLNGKSYSLTEANFSLFWGLAIMLYEATLVSNDSPMDQYLAGRTFDPATGAVVTEGSPLKLGTIANRLTADYGYAGGTAGILRGLGLFEQPLPPFGAGRQCIACHIGAPTTSASVANLVAGGGEPGDGALKAAGFDLRMERMFMQVPPVPTDVLGTIANVPGAPAFFTDQISFEPAVYAVTVTNVDGAPNPPSTVPAPAPTAVYDAGWYHIGVRPPADNPGLGAADPFGSPLSWVEFFQQTLSDPGNIKIVGGALGCADGALVDGRPQAANPLFPQEVLNPAGFPLLSGPLARSEAVDTLGSFKTPALRNVELTGPYFHNGGKATLRQVVEFYDDGADFPAVGDPDRDADFDADLRSPLVKFYGALARQGFGMTGGEIGDLIAFLLSLTDERVRWEKAPFDHPQLFVPNGQDASGNDLTITLPAVGAAGASAPLAPFLRLNPFQP